MMNVIMLVMMSKDDEVHTGYCINMQAWASACLLHWPAKRIGHVHVIKF